MAKLKVGNGLEEGVTIGPLIDAKAAAKVKEHIDDAVSQAPRSSPGARPTPTVAATSNRPSSADVPKSAKVSKEETFGPLAPLFRFKGRGRGHRTGQRTEFEFGLATYFYARDLSRVFRVAEPGVRMVGINTGPDLQRSRPHRRR